MCVKILICLSVLFFHNAAAQIAVYHLELRDLYKMQTGIGWPHVLSVFQGHEAQLKLDSGIDNQQSCYVLTPAGVTFNVQQPPSNRYESWSDGCGLRVRNVMPADQGRWRLTAFNDNHNITGWTELHVEANINEYSDTPIILHDGDVHPNLDLSSLDSSYCLVQQPFSDRTLVPGHCSMSLDRATRAVQGNWHLLLGLPGRVTELAADRSVTVESERLDTGFIHANSKLHLFCNLHHSEKNITFCRFQRTTGSAGYNIVDGLSDGEHSYYGDGFARRKCGMTVENPTAGDYTSWRCTVGVQERVGTAIEQRTPLQALIRVTGPPGRIARSIRHHEDVVFVQTGMSATLSCAADVTLSYCWFLHPNGTHFTPVPLLDDDQLFWYTGESLSVGDCGITFSHVTDVDNGAWSCHMGPRDTVGVELTDSVQLRVTGPLAAREKEVNAVVGGNMTLYCHSSNGNRPLDYCRFLSPNNLGISIDETVTQDNAVLDRFWFTSGRALDYGDCSLTVAPVTDADVGLWTCAALVDEEILEFSDTIRVSVGETHRRSLAGIIGMSVGASIMFLIFGGAMIYKYGNLSLNIPWRRTNNTDADTLSLGRTISTRTSFTTEGATVDVSHFDRRNPNSSDLVSVSLNAVSEGERNEDGIEPREMRLDEPNMISLGQTP